MNLSNELTIREVATVTTAIARPVQTEIERLTIGDHRLWVRASADAQQWDVRIVTPILAGDEYELQPIKRDSHEVRTVIDIGGHVGAFALKIKRLWPNARVIGVEPDPIGAQLYRINTRELAEVHVIEAAVVGKARRHELTLHRNGREPANAASNYVREVARDLTAKALAREDDGDIAVVSGVSIVEILEEYRVDQVDILKVDCEGAESEVLEDLHTQGWFPRIRWLRGEWHFEESISRIRAAVEHTHVLTVYTPPASARSWNGFFLAHRRGDTASTGALRATPAPLTTNPA